MTLGVKKQKTVGRCFELFLSAIKSDETKKIYTYHLDNFLKWNESAKSYDDLLNADEKSIIDRELHQKINNKKSDVTDTEIKESLTFEEFIDESKNNQDD